MYTILILLVSALALASPHTAYEQERDTIPTNQEAAYGLSYPLLGDSRFLTEIPPVMRKIAVCESGNRQFDEAGNVLHGEMHVADVGKYQINSAVWEQDAKKLGYDIFTEQGNEQFALELYRRFNTLPWESSRACWGKLELSLVR